jgi:hypothetical protein
LLGPIFNIDEQQDTATPHHSLLFHLFHLFHHSPHFLYSHHHYHHTTTKFKQVSSKNNTVCFRKST